MTLRAALAWDDLRKPAPTATGCWIPLAKRNSHTSLPLLMVGASDDRPPAALRLAREIEGAWKVQEIVHATLHEKPAGETHWSSRLMARAHGVSHTTVQKIWAGRGLKPHRVETFKLSKDPRFEEELADVVGPYMNPPERAIVLSMDEMSQIQALDRTQPSLPMKPGRAGTMTTTTRQLDTTLFAALDVLTGSVIGQCLPRHRHTEFLDVPPHENGPTFAGAPRSGRLEVPKASRST